MLCFWGRAALASASLPPGSCPRLPRPLLGSQSPVMTFPEGFGVRGLRDVCPVLLFLFPLNAGSADSTASPPRTSWVTNLPPSPASQPCELAHPVPVILSTACAVKSPSNHPLLPHEGTSLPRHAPFSSSLLKLVFSWFYATD